MPLLQLQFAEPVVGAVLSVALPSLPCVMFTVVGTVHVLAPTVQVVPAATVQFPALAQVVPLWPTTPLVQLRVAEPVVGAVLSVTLVLPP